MPFCRELSVTRESPASSLGNETIDPHLVLGLCLALEIHAGLMVLKSVTEHQVEARRRNLGISVYLETSTSTLTSFL